MFDWPGDPLLLTFRSPPLEVDWWRYHARVSGGLVRGGVLGLFLLIAGFAAMDVLAFPQVQRELLSIRAVVLLLMSPAAWAFVGDEARLARWGQLSLAYLAVVVMGSLAPMGTLIAEHVTDEQVKFAVPALIFSTSLLYGVSGLRFAFAAPIGLATTLGFFGVLVPGRSYEPAFAIAVVLSAVGATAIGLVTCWALEYQARRDFLRQRQLELERQKTEELLRNIVPDALAKRLEAGQTPVLDRLPDVTILFATLERFEPLTRHLSSLEAVTLLDGLVADFDARARELGVERIKTIGATYMAAAGLLQARPDHASAAARLAIAMIDVVARHSARSGLPLSLRVGLASGPVMAGVIGRTRLAFDCWGDIANTAARLDSYGDQGRIQCTQVTAERLGDGFRVTARGPVPLKGKGIVQVFDVTQAPG